MDKTRIACNYYSENSVFVLFCILVFMMKSLQIRGGLEKNN